MAVGRVRTVVARQRCSRDRSVGVLKKGKMDSSAPTCTKHTLQVQARVALAHKDVEKEVHCALPAERLGELGRILSVQRGPEASGPALPCAWFALARLLTDAGVQHRLQSPACTCYSLVEYSVAFTSVCFALSSASPTRLLRNTLLRNTLLRSRLLRSRLLRSLVS